MNVDVGPPRNLDTEMFIPRNLVELFKSSSAKTTQDGKELGAILAGQFIEDEEYYKVTHLVIPQQTGRPDSWTVGDERQLTNFFITHPNLILLGFIHSYLQNPSIVSLAFAPEE